MPPVGFRRSVLYIADSELLDQRLSSAVFGGGAPETRLLLGFNALRQVHPQLHIVLLAKPVHPVPLPPGVSKAMFGEGEKAKFIADRMCGRLVRWLRCAGYDCEMLSDNAVGPLARCARRERRVVLTCSRKYAQQLAGVPYYLVLGADVRHQFLDVVGHFGLRPEPETLLSRCSKCNGLLRTASHEEVTGIVPDNVIEHVASFWRCKGCGQIFWQGSTYRNVSALFSELFGYDPDVDDSAAVEGNGEAEEVKDEPSSGETRVARSAADPAEILVSCDGDGVEDAECGVATPEHGSEVPK
jgi:uncharacterized protein with PIN domain